MAFWMDIIYITDFDYEPTWFLITPSQDDAGSSWYQAFSIIYLQQF